MNFIRIAAVSLGAAIALITSATIQAQTTPTPTPDTSRDEVEISGIATRQMQDQVRALVAAYLGLWSIEVPSHSGLDFVAENAVFEYPYADDAYRRIEGREAIEFALREFPATARNWIFSDPRLFQTTYPDTFFVEFTAQAYVPATRRTYESRHLARITVTDGKISAFLELWDDDAKVAAFAVGGNAEHVSATTVAPQTP